MTSKNPFLKVGVLWKLGKRNKNWLKRGFACRGDLKLLMYFRKREDFKLYAENYRINANKVAGEVNLIGARAFLATYVDRFGARCCLEIRTNTRNFYIAGLTQQSLNEWVVVLVSCGVVYCTPSSTDPLLAIIPRGPKYTTPQFGMQGYIEKRGKTFTAFKNRFVRLEQNEGTWQLGYYKRHWNIKPRGAISLAGCFLQPTHTDPNDETAHLQFEIRTGDRCWILRAGSRDDKAAWVRMVQLALDHVASDSLPPIQFFDNIGEEKDEEGKEKPKAIQIAAKVTQLSSILEEEEQKGVQARKEKAPEPERAVVELSRESEGNQSNWALNAEVSEDEGFVEGSEEQVEPVEHKMSTTALEFLANGAIMLKFCRFGRPHKKFVLVVEDRIHWIDPANRITYRKYLHKKKSSIELGEVVNIHTGKQTKCFQLKKKEHQKAPEDFCFSVEAATRSLDLQAESKEQRDMWVRFLTQVCKKK